MTTKHSREIQETIHRNSNILLKAITDDMKKNKAILALRHFTEHMDMLKNRLNEVLALETIIENIADDDIQAGKLHKAQLFLVDKVEAFHQQVYVVISALIAIHNHIGIKGIKQQHPIDSVTKFLEFARQNSYKSALHDQLTLLQKSVDYRAKFVDHPQQHIMHDWMTYNFEGQNWVIYFLPKSNNVYPIYPFHPSDPRFKPPVDCGSDFYVAPHPHLTYGAIQLTSHILLDL